MRRLGMLTMASATSVVGACGGEVRGDDATVSGSTTNITGASATTGAAGTTGSDDSGRGGDTEKLDVEVAMGCQYVDLLFVIDNSASMQTYQQALADEFPGFAQSMFDVLPAGVDVHVAITTTDFDVGCDAAESTSNCQSTATLDEVESHYIPPTAGHDGGNGTQGRLFSWSGQRWFETTTDSNPAELVTWFSGAATAAGEDGCSFEMPVAAAGWATDPANATTNDGFLRDEGGLFVVFFLTDEPDKSPESRSVYGQMVLDAKAGCGGRKCVFVSGLIPACTIDINQKLWQFMELFGDEPPPWGDIVETSGYSELFGDALATAVAQACADIPVP